MASVVLKNISQFGREHFAAEGALDLEIQDREFIVLAGPDGSGKSAILRLIAGLEEISHGDILLDDRCINDIRPHDRDIALVSHDYTPYPRMTVYENLAFGLERRKFAKTEIKKRIVAAAEILGLGELLEKKPDSLSGEERQRIALARAVVRQPKVFLFDEPFSTLDSDARTRGRAEIKKLHQRLPVTMIYATRDPVEALAIANRLVVLDRGAVQQDGSAQSIYDEPANLFVAGFVGEPPMNLVRGTLKQDRDSLFFSEQGDGTIEIRMPMTRFAGARDLAGEAVVLGIRPDEIELAPASVAADRSSPSFGALVERVEPKGSTTDLYLQTGAHDLICRSRRWIDQGEGGSRAQFEINLEKTHLFDRDSGRRIMPER